jgi:hypothetical protein
VGASLIGSFDGCFVMHNRKIINFLPITYWIVFCVFSCDDRLRGYFSDFNSINMVEG